MTATTVAAHERGSRTYTTRVGLRPPGLVYGSSRLRYRSGRRHGRILVCEMHDVVRGDANADGLVLIIGSNMHMITIVTGSEGAPGAGVGSGRTC